MRYLHHVNIFLITFLILKGFYQFQWHWCWNSIR